MLRWPHATLMPVHFAFIHTRRFKNYCIGQTALSAHETYQMTQWETLRVWHFSISIFFGERKILADRFGIGRLLCHIYLPHTICTCATRIMAILHLIYRTISCRARRRWSIGMRFECWPSFVTRSAYAEWTLRAVSARIRAHDSMDSTRILIFAGVRRAEIEKMLLSSNDPAILHRRPLKNHELCSVLWAPVFRALN